MTADLGGRGHRARVPGVSLVLGLLAALLPKCPMCFAAYLPLLGVSAGVAGAAGGLLRPAGIVVAICSLAVIVLRRRAWHTRGPKRPRSSSPEAA